MANTKLGIEIVADNAKALRGLRETEQGLKGLGAGAKQAAKDAADLESKLANTREVAGAAVLAGTTALIGTSIQAAGDLAETQSKANTVFGESIDLVNKFGENAAESYGMSKQAAIDASSTFGNLFVQLGTGQEESAKLSVKLTGLASDFASFHNADITEVIEAQTAAFRGEYDAVQRFVPTINAAKVEQQAMAETGKANAKELTAQEKAMATYTLLVEGAGPAMGDFARTSDSMANQTRIAKAQLQDASAELGQSLIPAATKAAEAVAVIAKAFGALPGPAQSAIVGVGGLTLGLGLLAPKIREGVQVLGLAKDKLTGFGKAASDVADNADDLAASSQGAASGASKLNLALGALAVVGAAVTIKSMADEAARFKFNAEEAAKATDEQLATVARNLAQLDASKLAEIPLESLYAMRDAVEATGGKALPELADAIKEVEAEEKRAAVSHAEHGAAVTKLQEDAVEAKDGFLSLAGAIGDAAYPLENTNRLLGEQADVLREVEQETRDATSAALEAFSTDLAYQDSLRRTTEAEKALNEARAAGDRDAIVEAERNLNEAIIRQVEQKLALAVAEAEANGKQLSATESARLQRDALDEARKSTGYWNDDLEILRQRLDAAANSAAAAAAQIAALALQQAVAGIGDEFAGAFGIGRRAAGGPVRAGRPYVVGDGGRSELFVPRTDGVILPDAGTALRGGTTSIQVDVHGVADLAAAGDIIGERIARKVRLVAAA